MNKRNPYIKISIDEKNKAIDGAAIQKKKESADVDINKYFKAENLKHPRRNWKVYPQRIKVR